MTQIYPAELVNFIVYNPNIGKKEEEKEKLLFFHPSETKIDEQLNYCGFFEALVSFSTFFFTIFFFMFLFFI
jgi:hypothetical protein